MRDHSIVTPEFWTGNTGRTLRTYGPEVRELAFYLITAPNNSMFGLYYKPMPTMALETGRSERIVKTALDVLQSVGYCQYDPINEWVWVIEMAQIQLRPLPLKPIDYKVAACNRWYRSMPKNSHLGPFFDRYCDDLHLDPPKRVWSPSPLTPTNDGNGQGAVQQPLISTLVPVSVPVPEASTTDQRTARFERFWTGYPKKVGKKAARIEWDKINPDDALTDRIVQAVARHRRSVRWLRDNGIAIPDPERYIKKERWNDEDLDGPALSKQTIKNTAGFGTFLDDPPERSH